ncbi:FkbM family methyltransferase [Frankia sp. Cppng1_Ct_nod]|uniref:FkbM family methyltransferase n=1 Tax=Frankia sp. Cppng1_Ct_nod TaxID=2897162 RepID=UPI0013EF98D3|nr:FkbM family methyltransferase [Frankia sp. Cppng1_Ct_nod]
MTRGQLVGRELSECVGELQRAARVFRPRYLAPAFFWIAAYHAGMFLHPMVSRRTSTISLNIGNTVVRARFRHNQSDLYILRENFVQRIYDFDYAANIPPPTTIVDLGANIGLSALYFQARFPAARLLAVEPVADNAELLRVNARLNDFNWLVEDAAIGAVDGSVTLYPNEWWSSSSTSADVAQAREGGSDRLEGTLKLPEVPVRCVTVGDLLDRHGIETVDILKMDIEGAEAEVLRGTTPWLARVRLLIIEIHRKYVDEAAVVEHLSRAGFRRVAGRSGPTDVFVRG